MFHRTHILKTWRTPPPPRISVRGAWKTSWSYDNERKNLYSQFFFEFVLWTHRNYFFVTTMTQKSTMMSKLVAQFTKKTKFITFFRKLFFSKVACGYVEGSFDNLAEGFLPSYRKFCSSYQKWYIYFSYKKKRFSSILSTWHVQCSFNKPLKSFPMKSWVVLAQNPK